jgi:dTDP-4-amino-4,6-dideoxygalactose transaminase
MVSSASDLRRTLAVDGGIPLRTAPLAPWPHYADDEIAAVAAVLRSGAVNYWTGREGRIFEEEFAAHAGRRRAVALMNGTVALELALLALGIGPGDDVIVTPRSFFASAGSVALCGARPVFADIDRDSQNLTADTIEASITPKTRAILVVHHAGWPCDMEAISALAERRGLRVIADCAQAHGATYRGRPIGSFGDIATYSFCQDKIMSTCGEGGMLVTDSDELWRYAWEFKDHGKSYAAVYQREHPIGFRWLHESFGTNWRLTEPQSAVGRVQLSKLEQWVRRRRLHAQNLDERLSALPALRLAKPSGDVRHAHYRYYAFVRPECLARGWSRDRIMQAIIAEGIPCFAGTCPAIYREVAFRDTMSVPPQPLPVAEELGETSVAFLVHPTLSEADMDDTVRAIEKVFSVATA